jgi:Ca-activated chloride channel homolog
MALVEIDPVLTESGNPIHTGSYAKLKMNYQLPGANTKIQEEYIIPNYFKSFHELPNYFRFSASVALFGGMLKKSSYTQKSTWDDLAILAKSSYDPNDVSQSEFLVLIDKAKKIYHKEKKKKKEKVQSDQ